MIDFTFAQDSNRMPSTSLLQSDTIYNIVLSSNVEQIISVPDKANIVLFQADGNFYCKFNATAAVPSLSVVNGTGSELNPVMRTIDPTIASPTIHLIAKQNTVVALCFYHQPKPISYLHA